MKKLILILMAALMLLSLCACGSDVPQGDDSLLITAKPKAETTEPAETEEDTEPKETTEGTEPAETTVDTTEPEATTGGNETQTGSSEKKALAESCVGKNVSELYALIGKPNSSDYAPSCLVDGDDGMLYYDGFVVYTTRLTDGTETVYYVE